MGHPLCGWSVLRATGHPLCGWSVLRFYGQLIASNWCPISRFPPPSTVMIWPHVCTHTACGLDNLPICTWPLPSWLEFCEQHYPNHHCDPCHRRRIVYVALLLSFCYYHCHVMHWWWWYHRYIIRSQRIFVMAVADIGISTTNTTITTSTIRVIIIIRCVANTTEYIYLSPALL